VIQLLQKRGWKTFSGYEPGDPGEHHHYQRMHDESCVLEVHWTLPDFGSADADEIWKNSKEINAYHHVLTPEMNLLLISAHASHNSFTHVSQWKILTDAGVLLKFESVDWNKVHRLADLWGILRPDILFRCWSEFFPEGILPEESSIPEQQKLIQDIFEMRSVVSKYSVYEKSVTKAESHNIRWFLNKLKFYTPA